jgi:hypothetical protein
MRLPVSEEGTLLLGIRYIVCFQSILIKWFILGPRELCWGDIKKFIALRDFQYVKGVLIEANFFETWWSSLNYNSSQSQRIHLRYKRQFGVSHYRYPELLS